MVRMKLRELWAKGDSDKIIYIRAVQITQCKEVDDRECYSSQIWN